MEENYRLRCLELALGEASTTAAHVGHYCTADVIERADKYAAFVIRGEKPTAKLIRLRKKRK